VQDEYATPQNGALFYVEQGSGVRHIVPRGTLFTRQVRGFVISHFILEDMEFTSFCSYN